MKYVKFIYISIGIILLIIVTIMFIPQKATMKIAEISIAEANLNNSSSYSSYARSFDITEQVLYSANVKTVTLRCNMKNDGFKKIKRARLIFEQGQDLPPLILGNKIDILHEATVDLSAFESKNASYQFLVDASQYSDDEILELLKDVDVSIVETTETVRQEDNKIILKHKIVSSNIKLAK